MCALKMFWNACTWHVLDDLTVYGQWRNLHDQLLNGPKHVTNDYLVWSLTFITQVNTNNIVIWETLQNNADWNCFKTPILQGILRTRNLLQVEHCAFLEVTRSCQQVGCVRNNLQFRTAQQESGIISLDASLRMDGIPALDLWDLIVPVLHGNTNQSEHVHGNLSTYLTRKQIPGKIDDLNNVDFVSSNANSSRQEAMLYILEDNEAVIKMIIKGRSPTRRHVSRTHRVALDWLFDRISLNPKIQIK